MNPIEALRRIREGDPRKDRIELLRDEVRSKLKDLSENWSLGVEAYLTHAQSERLYPSPESGKPLKAFIAPCDPDGGYECQLHRDPSYIDFTVTKKKATVEMRIRDTRVDRWFQLRKMVPLFPQGLDKTGRQLHALELSNKIATSLLEIREESPTSFRRRSIQRAFRRSD